MQLEKNCLMGQVFFGVKLRHCQIRKNVHGDVACSGLLWCSVWVPQIQARWYAWQHLHRIIRGCRPARIPQEPTKRGVFHAFTGQMQASLRGDYDWADAFG